MQLQLETKVTFNSAAMLHLFSAVAYTGTVNQTILLENIWRFRYICITTRRFTGRLLHITKAYANIL
jgi:hypothetical protein